MKDLKDRLSKGRRNRTELETVVQESFSTPMGQGGGRSLDPGYLRGGVGSVYES